MSGAKMSKDQKVQKGYTSASDLRQELIDVILKSLPTTRDSQLRRLQLYWQEAAGELSCYSWPCRFQNGRLTVKVENSIYLSELSSISAGVLRKLEKLSGINLTKLHLVQGSLREERSN